MKSFVAATTTVGVVVVALAGSAGYNGRTQLHAARPHGPVAIAPESLTTFVRNTCGLCHNETDKAGGISFEQFSVPDAAKTPELGERMITKLRAGIMPPPDIHVGGDTIQALVETLESMIDKSAASNPNPGGRTFQRLNRAEYEESIHDLLGIDIDAGRWLPLDTKSANFDNIADVQTPSATLLDSYLDAASEIARLAVGDPKAAPASTIYQLPRLASQLDQTDGAPAGTRGGIAVNHIFPADGDYVFAISLHAIPTGQLFGSTAPFDETVEISVDGERVATIAVDRGMSQADPAGMELKAKPVHVKAGEHRVAAAFIRTFDGPVNDNIAPIGHSLADTQIGSQSGITVESHLSELVIRGPANPTGVSETESRRRIFRCHPKVPKDERPCAQKIVASIAGSAYRRPVTTDETTALMGFYDQGAKDGGFEIGVRTALEAILASPRFIFRFEQLPANAAPGHEYAIASLDLASRLSFFLWGAPPDSTLIAIAKRGTLSDPAVLEAQTRRLIADPRSEALATRFAAQWLRLQDIDKVHPDALQYPDFHEQLADDMRRETEEFFMHLVRENGNVLDMLSANYTYLNEALADHYGIPGVTGPEFRRVQYPDDRRGGLLGQASILTLTSHANRTSPVLRGKWVMEVLIGSPPPPPPPNVPDLEKTGETKDGHLLTTRERMEQHRASPQCASCHQYMDPIGLALDNFDVTGRWRIRENGAPVDTRGQLYDGTAVSSLADLERALMQRKIAFIRTFTQNLMAYAVGRRMEYYDGPAIRRIARDADANGNRMQDFITGVVMSDAFRMTKVQTTASGSGSTEQDHR